jgi:hypothetical protein
METPGLGRGVFSFIYQSDQGSCTYQSDHDLVVFHLPYLTNRIAAGVRETQAAYDQIGFAVGLAEL